MPIFQFIAQIDPNNHISYYANCKNEKSYIRNIRCQWKKTYKSIFENNKVPTIHSIIGGQHGLFECVELAVDTQCEDGICYQMTDKEVLKFFINLDKSAININKLNFCKSRYNDEYRNKKKLTFLDLSRKHNSMDDIMSY